MNNTVRLPEFYMVTGNEGEERPSEMVIREIETAISRGGYAKELHSVSYYQSRLFFRLWKTGFITPFFSGLAEKLFFRGSANYLIVLMGPRFPKCFPHFFRKGLKAIYMFDAWPSYYGYIERFARDFRVDFLFVSSKQSAENLNQLMGKNNIFWVPEGVEPGDYKYLPVETRDIDVLAFGRKNEHYHSKIEAGLKEKNLKYVFSSENEKIFSDKNSFVNGLSRSKISVCFPTNITHPERSGGIETMTNRFLQSIASKCLVLGKAPGEMVQLFGYNPVIEVNIDDPVNQIINILDNFNQYEELIEKNYKTVVENHSWSNRAEMISTILSEKINQMNSH